MSTCFPIEELDEMIIAITKLRDKQDVIACTNDDDDICIRFDYVIDAVDDLKKDFKRAIQSQIERINRLLSCTTDRHERSSLIISLGLLCDQHRR